MMKLLYAWLQLVALEQVVGSSPTDTTATAADETDPNHSEPQHYPDADPEMKEIESEIGVSTPINN